MQKDPISFAKKLTVQAKTIVWHLSDIEGSTPADYQTADNTLSRLKETKNLGKSIVYKYGYSNLSFDLWMILHKRNHSGSVSAVGNYLAIIPLSTSVALRAIIVCSKPSKASARL